MNRLRLICYIFGYIFIIGAFFSIALKQLGEHDAIGETVAEQIQQMSEGQSYNTVDVREAIVKADREVWNRTATWLFKPAYFMVAGAILIDIGARRKQRPKAEAAAK